MATRKVADLWLRRILEVLYQRRTVTRPEIVDATGLNLASVSHAMRFLLRQGTVVKMGDIQGDGGGRRREVFTLNGEAAYFIAVDIEGQRIRFALMNFKSDIRFRWEEELGWSESLDIRKLFSGMVRVVRSLEPEQRHRVAAAGISYPGLLDENGRLTAVNLGWHEYPLVAELQEKSRSSDLNGIPFFLEAHRDTSLLAERLLGTAQGIDDGVLIFGERGIGVGILTGGTRVQGWRSMAGEIGHMTVDAESEEVCRCGKRGCLEAFASPAAMIRAYERRTGRQARMNEIYDRAREGEPEANATVEQAARALGLALSHAVSLLNPKIIVLSGHLAAGEDVLLPVIKDEIARHTLPGLLQGLSITCSALGLDTRLKGAGAFAFRKALADPALLSRMCSPVFSGKAKAETA